MARYLGFLLLCQMVLCCATPCWAEDYSACRARCAQDYTDCMNEPQASEPQVQLAKQAACNQTVQSCYSDCENFRPSEEEVAPESNPNVIRK